MTRVNFSEFALGATRDPKSRAISSGISMSRNKLVLSVLPIAVAARNIVRSRAGTRDTPNFLASLTDPRAICGAKTIGAWP